MASFEVELHAMVPVRFWAVLPPLMACAGCSPPQQVPQPRPASPAPVLNAPPAMSAAPTPCEVAREQRARVAQLLQQGKLDRTVRVIQRADALCPAQQGESAAVLASTLAELRKGQQDGRAVIEAGLAANKKGDHAEAQRLFDRGRAALENAEGARMTVEPAQKLNMVAGWSRGGLLAELHQGHVTLRLASTLEERFRLEGAAAPVAFSPNGTRLVSGSAKEGVGLLWDTDNGRQIAELPGHRHGIEYLRFSRDSATIESQARDRTRVAWDAVTGREIGREMPRKQALNRDVFPSPVVPVKLTYWLDPKVAFGPDEVVCGNRIKRCPESGPRSIISPVLVELSPDGSRSATEWRRDLADCVWQCPSESVVVLGDVATGKELHRLFPCGMPRFSPNGAAVLSTGGGGFSDSKLRLWSVATGKLLFEMDGTFWAFSPDGTRFAASAYTSDGPVKTRMEFRLTADGSLLPSAGVELPDKPRYVLTPEGYVDFDSEETRSALVCRLKQYTFPFDVCEEQRRVPGLLHKLLSGDATVEP
ncbi:MAG: hypothetical protein HY898_22510 [Deltaproteobacteria bacterium]|nr:hypothetical protein [Deltaproteobacteria bacterium]